MPSNFHILNRLVVLIFKHNFKIKLLENEDMEF